MDEIIKTHIRNIITKYTEHKQFSYGLDRAIGELSPFVMFNKLKDDKNYVSFSTGGKRPSKFSRNIADLLDDDMLEYIKELQEDSTINTSTFDLEFLIRIVLAHIYMFCTTSSFGEVLESEKYDTLKSYIHKRYRIKFRYHLLYNIIVRDVISNININTIQIEEIDYTPTKMFIELSNELSREPLLINREPEVYLYLFKLYMENKIEIPTMYCSEIKQGVVKQFLQTNLVSR